MLRQAPPRASAQLGSGLYNSSRYHEEGSLQCRSLKSYPARKQRQSPITVEGRYYDENERLIEVRLGEEGIHPAKFPGSTRAAGLESASIGH